MHPHLEIRWRRRPARWAVVLTLLGLLLTVAPAIPGGSAVRVGANPVPPYSPFAPRPLGSALPNFAVLRRDSTLFTRADLAPQRPILVVFFLTGETINQAELREIAPVVAAHPALQVVLIGGASRDSSDAVYDFPARSGLPMPAYYDARYGGQSVRAAWEITAYPALILADGSGTVRAGRQGFLSGADLNAVVSGIK